MAQSNLDVHLDAINDFVGEHPKDKVENLEIFLMSSFDDSVIISIGKRNAFNRFCKTDEILGQAASVMIKITENEEGLTIYCCFEKLKQTIRLKKGYGYLYVWKNSGKFQFEFTNKIKWLE